MGEKQEKRARRRVATVGTFDGLHRGHRRVLSMVKELAEARGLEPMVVSFDRHPLETIAPERAPRLIQSPSTRTNTLYGEGLRLHTLEFTPALAAMTAREWLRKMHEEHGVDLLVVGYDNTFGSDGTKMNISDYCRLGRETGVEVVEAPYEPHAASSAIRRLLTEGNVEEANHLLGHTFTITGDVVIGKRLGHTLGFPTANVRPAYRAHYPRRGVYAVEVDLPDGRGARGVANIGVQPTIAPDAPMTLEVHIPGYKGDLYGQRINVKFLRRLRDEKKFDSVEELRLQIAQDIENMKNI